MNGEGQSYPEILPIQEQLGVWDMTLYEHEAERAGRHFDLRLMGAGAEGLPEERVAHSWAIRKGLPEPGQKRLAIQQPTHTRADMEFKGPILVGYGKGEQKIKERGQVDVLEATDDAVKFNRYKGKKTEKFKMVRTGDNRWLVINYTPTHESKGVPKERPPYKEDTIGNIQKYIDGRYVLEPKYDGAHDLLISEPGKDLEVYSYRDAKMGLIEHTPKISRLFGVKSPEDMAKVVLRGEVWAPGLDVSDIGGLLNSHAPKARAKQQKSGQHLEYVGFDVDEIGGRKMQDVPYAEKLLILEQLASRIPITVTDVATSPSQKKKLVESIWSGDDARTKEGVVAWPLDGGMPTRIPVKKTYDVVVHDIYPIRPEAKTKKNMAGGVVYSWEEDPEVPVARLGTGFTDEQRKELWLHPERFIGQVAMVESKPLYPSGILRTASFKGWHPDKAYKIENPGELHLQKEASLFLDSPLNLDLSLMVTKYGATSSITIRV